MSFAVNNDGVGGRTAMYVDDARLTACNPGPAATTTPTPTADRDSAANGGDPDFPSSPRRLP